MAEEKVDDLLNDMNKKNNTMTIVIVVVLLLTVVGAGGAAYFFFFKGKGAEGGAEGGEHGEAAAPAKAAETKPAEGGGGGGGHEGDMVGIINRLDPFIVNLNEVDASRYLKLTIELEVTSEETVKELDKRGPQVRDLAVGILSSKSFADIQGADGKYRLKEELMFAINKILSNGQIKRIYFTQFVVQ